MESEIEISSVWTNERAIDLNFLFSSLSKIVTQTNVETGDEEKTKRNTANRVYRLSH